MLADRTMNIIISLIGMLTAAKAHMENYTKPNYGFYAPPYDTYIPAQSNIFINSAATYLPIYNDYYQCVDSVSVQPCYGVANPLPGRTCGNDCDRNQGCPYGYYCHKHPFNRFSVCCPRTTYDPPKSDCTLPIDPGPCRASIPSWGYDKETGRCERFIYGGCLGNNNRFATEADCVKECNAVNSYISTRPECLLPKDPGPCKGLFPRWYFNQVTRQCELFDYGGCPGNANNFLTREACLQRCSSCKCPFEGNGACQVNTKNPDAEYLDACLQSCKCREGKLVRCYRVRKEFTSMTLVERQRYIAVYKRASTDPLYKPRFNQIIDMHGQLFNSGIHNKEVFLPWHRLYILILENLLREIDCRVTVPYWDWSLVSQNAWQNGPGTVWYGGPDDSGFGGAGFPVNDGPFRSSVWKLTDGTTSLTRSLQGTPPDAVAVSNILAYSAADFDAFELAMRSAMHVTVHCEIGGTMCNAAIASNAPEFFLHHGFIDKTWGEWQKKGALYLNAYFPSITQPLLPTTFTPAHVYDLSNLPGCVKVRYEESKHRWADLVRNFTSGLTRADIPYLPRRPYSLLTSKYGVEGARVFMVMGDDYTNAVRYENASVGPAPTLNQYDRYTQYQQLLGFNYDTPCNGAQYDTSVCCDYSGCLNPKPCPQGTFCSISQYGRFSVCCPNRDTYQDRLCGGRLFTATDCCGDYGCKGCPQGTDCETVGRQSFCCARDTPNPPTPKDLCPCTEFHGYCDLRNPSPHPCNLKCDCVPTETVTEAGRGVWRNCKRVRKDFTSMTPAERTLYIQTYKTAASNPLYKPRFDQYIKMHSTLFNTGIHDQQQFLPWHRFYLVLLENLLREIDCRVTIPYWDWSLWSHNPFATSTNALWNNGGHGFGGDGVPGGGCVLDGPFMNTNFALVDGTCLRRDFSGTFPDAVAVANCLAFSATDFTSFEVYLRGTLHNVGHCVIGGTMCSMTSANAPEFLLHHGFIDKIWYEWQKKGPTYLNAYYPGLNVLLGGTEFEPRDWINSASLPGCVAVEYEEPTHGDAPAVKRFLAGKSRTDLYEIPRLPYSDIYSPQGQAGSYTFGTTVPDFCAANDIEYNSVYSRKTPANLKDGYEQVYGFSYTPGGLGK